MQLLEEDANCIIDGMIEELGRCTSDPNFTKISPTTAERVGKVLSAAMPGKQQIEGS